MRIVRWTSWLVLALVLFGLAPRSSAQVSFGVAITFGPPELPVYEQPLCPAEGYIWTPGYWAWDDDYGDYFWVPGTWVEAPRVGYLWTPPYWGWGGDRFVFYDGYWGREVGFYGGINYGYGYGGRGYEGGRWDNDRFFYNRSVNNINTTNITNVYNTTVINNNTTNVTRVSYNGGNGGVSAQATAKEQAVAHEQHISPPAPQQQHIQAAKTDPQLRASANQGKPPIAATPRPAALRDAAVVPAKVGGHYTPPPNRGGNANSNGANNNANRPNNNTNANNNNNAQPNDNPNRPPSNTNPGNNNARPENNPNRPPDASRPANIVHPRDLPPPTRATPNTGNPKQDQRYQQQQDKLIQKQQQERDRTQQRQDQEHQRLQQQKANDTRQQQVEQRHQQQTQQLQQKHETQQQYLQQKYSPPPQRQQPPPQEKKPQH